LSRKNLMRPGRREIQGSRRRADSAAVKVSKTPDRRRTPTTPRCAESGEKTLGDIRAENEIHPME
jgi:hypothetical protein